MKKQIKNIAEKFDKDKKNKSAEKKQKTLVLIEQDKYDKIKKNKNNNNKKPRNNWNNQRTQVIYRDVPAPIQSNQYYNEPNFQDWGYSRPPFFRQRNESINRFNGGQPEQFWTTRNGFGNNYYNNNNNRKF